MLLPSCCELLFLQCENVSVAFQQVVLMTLQYVIKMPSVRHLSRMLPVMIADVNWDFMATVDLAKVSCRFCLLGSFKIAAFT